MSGRYGKWTVISIGWLLALYLIYAQAIPAVNYDLGVQMGTQESAEQVTAVGAAFWFGFAFGDLVVYLPLFILGLIGYGLGRHWGRTVLSAALGITIYWPVVCLATVVNARGAPGWHLPKESEYWIVLPLIALWALWGLWYVAANRVTSEH